MISDDQSQCASTRHRRIIHIDTVCVLRMSGKPSENQASGPCSPDLATPGISGGLRRDCYISSPASLFTGRLDAADPIDGSRGF